MLNRTGKCSLGILVLMFLLLGCQMVQEQTNREAPNQVQQREGRQEIKQGAKAKQEQKEKEEVKKEK
ncbi:hypothetical protein [Ammoniphilus sp. 3BR4]|uniref:hypothetical protein n=1 Tax=Ammoniphilus sp. 3BR4 TaxID=3158265 RepID=UPI0034668127